MKKLITLSNLTAGLTKSFITGEVRKLDRKFDINKKEDIDLIAKNIAELYNSSVKKLLKKKKLSRKEWDAEMAKKYKSMRWHNH